MKQERNVSLDILRILCVYMIVCGHVYAWGGGNELISTKFDMIGASIIKTIGMIEVSTFFVITGVFQKTKKTEEYFRKAKKLWIQEFSVSILIMIVMLFSKNTINLDMLLISIFPFFMNGYWFVSVYIVVLLLSPILNKFFDECDRRYVIAIFILFLVLTVIIPSVFAAEKVIVGGEYSILYAVFLLCSGKLIVRYSNYIKVKWCLIISISSVLFVVIHRVLMYLYRADGKMLEQSFIERIYSGSNSIIAYVLTVTIVACCYKVQVKIRNKHLKTIIERMAMSSLIIYIVHCNKMVIKYVFPMLRECKEKLRMDLTLFVIVSSLFIILIIYIIYQMFIIFKDKYNEIRCNHTSI